jgi:hypothetical protein
MIVPDFGIDKHNTLAWSWIYISEFQIVRRSGFSKYMTFLDTEEVVMRDTLTSYWLSACHIYIYLYIYLIPTT